MLRLRMVAPRLTHDQREKLVLADLESSFPNFAGQALSWIKVPESQDPPDFISPGPRGAVGLELVEWLDGDQMGPAKARESQREPFAFPFFLDADAAGEREWLVGQPGDADRIRRTGHARSLFRREPRIDSCFVADGRMA